MANLPAALVARGQSRQASRTISHSFFSLNLTAARHSADAGRRQGHSLANAYNRPVDEGVGPSDPANLRSYEQYYQYHDPIRPTFVAALRRCRGGAGATPRAATAAVRARASLSEREVAQLISCGLADKEVARRLGISTTTVRTHVGHAFRKLGVDSRLKLVQAMQA